MADDMFVYCHYECELVVVKFCVQNYADLKKFKNRAFTAFYKNVIFYSNYC